MIRPLEDYVVLAQKKEDRQTKSGIILNVSEKEQPSIGTVIATGPKVLDLKIGDNVIFQTYAGTKVKIDEQDYIVIEIKNIYAIIE